MEKDLDLIGYDEGTNEPIFENSNYMEDENGVKMLTKNIPENMIVKCTGI